MIVVLSMTGVTAFASSDSLSPRLSHTDGANFRFSATESGGHIDATYYGYDSFVRADLTVKVEKRFLLVFWSEVGTWSASSSDVYGMFSHVFTLNGSGMYRATFTLTITGSDGTTDVISMEIKSEC